MLLLVIATLSLIAVALLSVRERKREFGVLKTLGFTPGQITVSLTSSHALLALLAGILAIPLGIAPLRHRLQHRRRQQRRPSDRPLGWLTLVTLGLVVMAAAATSIPARLATRVAVSDTLRYE